MDQQDWQRILGVAGPAGILGLAFAAARGIIDQVGGWRPWLIGMTSAVVVSSLVGLGLHDSKMSVWAQSAVIGLCAYVSRDILLGLIQLSSMLAASPLEFFRKVRAAIRGDKEGGQ